MTTVLLADRDGSALGPLGTRTIPALLPVQAVPVLERMLQALVSSGIRSALVVTGPRAHEVERRFGKGIRWGIALEYVRREGDETTGDILRRLEHRLDGETLVVRGDVGNHAAVPEFVARAEDTRAAVVSAMTDARPAGLWRVRPGALKKAVFPREPASEEWTSGRDQEKLDLDTRFRLLDSIEAWRAADRADAAAVSPRARVYPGATLGNGTTVAEEAVVCAGAKLREVSVLPRSVIPPLLELENAIVSGNLVVRPGTGEAALLTDLLPAPKNLRYQPGSIGGRIAGVAALALSVPLWVVALAWALVANAGHATRRVTWNLNGPGTDAAGRPDRAPVSTFQFETAVPVLRDLPLVLFLASGKLALTGVAPMAPADEATLDEGWPQVRRERAVGLLAPSRMLIPPAAPAEVPLLMDAFEARRPTPGLVRLGLAALFGKGGWVAPRAFNPDEIEEIPVH